MKPKILFLCTGNSCRSQMAEGWARYLLGERIDAYSAGTTPQGLNPLAVEAMREAGVDITRQRSKHVDELREVRFDAVIAVCDRARESCPIWLGNSTRIIRAPFDDPPALARGARTKEEEMAPYRRVRDEIRRFVERLPELLTSPP